MLCAECGKPIDEDECINAEHPITRWLYACHRLLDWSIPLDLYGRADAR
jgi:hypothetical protein